MKKACKTRLDEFHKFLTLQRVAAKTKEAYLRSIRDVSSFHNQPAAELTHDQIQDFLLHAIQEKHLSWSSCNVLFCGLKKYYRDFLGWTDKEFSIPPRPRAKQLPLLLSKEEVTRILSAQSNIKHRALLTTIYGSGLRVSEAVRLKPRHIESERMMLRVEQGKGRKDRYTVLSRNSLKLLRVYWRTCQPGEWLFFGRDRARHMSIGTAQHIYYQAKEKAGITHGRGIHTLRHCFEGLTLFAICFSPVGKWSGTVCHQEVAGAYRHQDDLYLFTSQP